MRACNVDIARERDNNDSYHLSSSSLSLSLSLSLSFAICSIRAPAGVPHIYPRALQRARVRGRN